MMPVLPLSTSRRYLILTAIFDRETFDNIRQKMSNNAPRVAHPRSVPGFYLLSGLIYYS
jgi:hypothetical protein